MAEKEGEQGAAGETDFKAEFEKLRAEHESLKKSNEDLRLEFMSEEYLDFLNTKDGKSTTTTTKAAEAKAVTTSTDDDFKNLTPKQLYDKALKDAEEKINSRLTELQKKQEQDSQARIQADVKKFFEKNTDAQKYRQVMAGLANDPKYADADLNEIYKAAKDHVKTLNEGPTEEQKEKSRRSGGEKPGHSSSSFQKAGKKLSADEANEEAWEEVVGKDGLPPAI